jgi:hypothetical protein
MCTVATAVKVMCKISALHFLGAMAKLRKTSISFVVSFRPSFLMEQFRTSWKVFCEISCLNVFRKAIDKVQI